MGDEYVLQIGGVATGFGVEVCTSVRKSTVTYDLHHGLCQFIVVDRELIGIPAILIVSTVGVDRTEHAVVYGYRQLVFECMAGQSSMIDLDVYLEILIQAICL